MASVLFLDLDETLVAQERAFEAAYRSTAAWLASQIADADARALEKQIPEAAAAALAQSPIAATVRRCCFGGRDLLWGTPGTDSEDARVIAEGAEDFRAATWRSLLPRHCKDSGTRLAELSSRFRESMFKALTVFPDVFPALARLAVRYRLAIITNGMGAAQREKLAHLGLTQYFERVIASTDVGIGKPSGEIFAAALRAMGVSESEALMLGDSLAGDVHGAEAAGLAAVWIDRHATSTRSGAPNRIANLNGWIPPFERSGRAPR